MISHWQTKVACDRINDFRGSEWQVFPFNKTNVAIVVFGNADDIDIPCVSPDEAQNIQSGPAANQQTYWRTVSCFHE